ncbi:MAG: hypothetical protein O2955_08805 [Planctomycetota bacterium]|nr:hypothetical protein [Planctomycetota bacterium]
MLDPNHPIAKLAREDGRYRVDAYAFVFDALNHAHTVMDLGDPPDTGEPLDEATETTDEFDEIDDEEEVVERHVTGQELCTAICRLALEQYGYMAKCVFNSWGVHKTGDFGNIVFSLIEIGQMRKTDHDRREDFEDVFDFDRELVDQFTITMPE